MIKILKNDSILDILTKISQCEDSKIILEFPFGHPVLHNYLSLKILKTKVWNKSLLILTNDKTSQKIGKPLWIKYKKNIHEKHLDEKKVLQHTLKENYSFWEYALFEIKKIFWVVRWNILQDKKINSLWYYSNKHKNINKTVLFIFMFSLTCILLIFIYIYYFAINKTIITITPEISLQSKARNFTYEEYSESILDESLWNERNIVLIPIVKNISLEKSISTSWMIQKTENTAQWTAIFYNLLLEEITLLPFTQLENKQWVRFETREALLLPPATKTENNTIIPSETTTTLYGKIKLLNGEYSWETANILADTQLLIPKLGDLKTKIFAKAESDFSWWSNDFTKVITELDIENAKNIMKEALLQEWVQAIKKHVEEQNANNSIQMKVLPTDNIYKFTDPEIIVPDHIKVWDTLDNFVISWSIQVKSFMFNKDALVSKLSRLIQNTVIDEYEEIVNIDTNSLRISHIIHRNDNESNDDEQFVLKWTTQIEYYLSKNFRNIDNNYINALKYEIAWMGIDSARNILTNNRDINNVSISVQPFFFKNISNNPENIIFKVEK